MKKIISLVFIILCLSSMVYAKGTTETTKQHITIWWNTSQGANNSVFEEIIDNFNNTIGQEKNIEVEAIFQGKASDVLTKVNAASGTNTLPDIAMMDATAALDMNNSEYLVTVDKLGVNVDNILKCAISSYSSEKGLLAVPFNASALLYYYNKTVYDQKGVNAPQTLDDMISVVSTTGSKERMGFSGVPASFELTTFIGAQNGCSYMVNNKNGHEGAATEVLFGKNGTYKAFLEKWKAIYDTGYMDAITSGVTAEFTSGRSLAMLASSSNLASVLAQAANSFEVGVAQVPIVNSQATGGTVISGGALYSFTNSEAVKTVLEYLISDEVQITWSKATGYVPVNVKAYDTAEYKAFLQENPLYEVALKALLESDERLCNLWIPSSYSIYYSFQANIVDAIKGNMTIDEAVKDMVNILQSALDTYNSQN